ncbi:YceD family protein [Vaginella massiliensis]|uniref:YceD family protein n=1 Tax=Vaginella massiliensis TaxID=1816680 RepID=UPI0008398E1B|nr:DUF177 domain-containing protein [Vaginella massiliensis]
MDKLKNYNIIFSGLPLGKTEFDYEITQAFFDLFQFDQDFSQPKVSVSIELEKRSTMLELFIKLKGTVNLICDLSNEEFEQKIEHSSRLIVKFGDEFDDADDEIWVIPREEYQLNVAQLIYELILLSIPTKRIHPDVLTGDSGSEVLRLLNQYMVEEVDEDDIEDSVTDTDDEDDDDGDIDPRWAKLKDLKP